VFTHAQIVVVSVAAFVWFLPRAATGQIPSAATQIRSTVLAAPEEQRESATVLGYDASGALVTLRTGDNELVCLADDPEGDGFSAACYHESLEPYMARGRALVKEGVADPNERYRIRWQEADEGKLSMPEDPATLYVLTGSEFDEGTGTVADAYLRFVIYVPWATVEETGLPAQPMGPGTPWLMYPGTAGAHIMISPPRPSGR
jgi:hypothetical protein